MQNRAVAVIGGGVGGLSAAHELAREASRSRIENLYLAADYVRTHTDIATMESANEAARRATNGILRASGTRAPACRLWELRPPRLFQELQRLDERRFRDGAPHLLGVPRAKWLAASG